MVSDIVHEEWRPVDDWPYEVSDHGRVRRAIFAEKDRWSRPGRLLSQCKTKDGVFTVALYWNKKYRQRLVHRLVAFAFLGAPPSSHHEVAHWDGDGTNNRVSNLRWATHIENESDKIRHGTRQCVKGENNPRCVFTDVLLAEMISERMSHSTSVRRLSLKYGISETHARNVLRGLKRENAAAIALAAPPLTETGS